MSEQCKCGHPYSEHFPRSTDMSNAGGYGPCLHNFCACKEYASEPEHIEVAPGQQGGELKARCEALEAAITLALEQLEGIQMLAEAAHLSGDEGVPPKLLITRVRAALAASQPGKET